MRNLIDILDLTCEELDELIALAEDMSKDPKKYAQSADAKIVSALLF